MIKSITLKNWKSFGDATLYVDPLTVLIGANASGKSNFLDALVFLGELGRGRRLSEALGGTGNGYKGIRGGKEGVIRSGETEAVVVLELGSGEDSLNFRYELRIKRDDSFGYLIDSESLSCLIKEEFISLFTFSKQEHLFLEMDVDRWARNNVDSVLHQDVIFVAKRLIKQDLMLLRVIDPIPQNMRTYSELTDELAADGANLAGYLANYPDKKELEKRLSKELRHLPENEILRVWGEPVGRLASDAMIYCEERWSPKAEPFLLDARRMSDGTLRLLAILTALLTAERGSTIAVEEVENGLHPSRAKFLVSLLNRISEEREIDIICTTHDPALLDAFGLDMVPSISLIYRDPESGASGIRALNEIEHFERIITKGTLGDLVAAGRFEAALKPS